MNPGILVNCFWIGIWTMQFVTACLHLGAGPPARSAVPQIRIAGPPANSPDPLTRIAGPKEKRIVLFPEKSIGQVVFVESDRLLVDGGVGKPIEAEGRIIVPAGKGVILLYHGRPVPKGEAPVDFRALESLKEGDIQGIAVPFGKVEPGGLKTIARFGSLRYLGLSGFNGVGDECLAVIGKLSSLQVLFLPETKVTDKGIRLLAGLKDLEVLGLYGTGVTDRGVAEIAKLKKLRILDLSGTRVTDAGIARLAALDKLERLDLTGTRVSERAGSALKKQLPRLDIIFRER